MTRTVTSSRVRATTAMKAPVRRPWKVRGRSRRSRSGTREGRSAGRSALGERVADTSHRQNEGGRRRVVLDLVAEMADVDVDRLLVLVERLVVAQELQQLPPRVHAARPGGEMAEDLELGRRQADPPIAPLDAAALEVDD